jgi:hypothetical protein
VSLVDDPEALGRFFSDTLVGAFYSADAAGDGTAELSLFPLAPGRASRRERQRLERAIDPWTEVLARYFRAAGRLYDYLEEHPDRAEIAFSVLLEEVLPEEDGGRRELLHRHEEPLVEAVEQAMSDAWEVLLVSSQEAYSINEVSRLVYDPFPARLRVEVPGEVVAIEGFAATPESGLVVPSVSLWQALTDLQGVWLEPDPLLLYVDRRGGTTGARQGRGSTSPGSSPGSARTPQRRARSRSGRRSRAGSCRRRSTAWPTGSTGRSTPAGRAADVDF